MTNCKQHTPGTRKLIGIAMIAVLLMLGFCPLRNTLFAMVFQSKGPIPKISGMRLLSAQENCKTMALNFPAVVQRYKDWEPHVWPRIVLTCLSILAGLPFLKCRRYLFIPPVCRQTVPIYKLNCIMRI